MKGKLLLTAILGAMLVGSSAFASLARVAVMGSQPMLTNSATTGAVNVTNVVNGSLWYDDSYNVFYNPSYINDYKNYVVVQKGLEGGWFSTVFENFAYGLYFNRGGGTFANAQGTVSNVTGMEAPGINGTSTFSGGTDDTNNLNTVRPIELFLGGDTGIKWGAKLAWAYNRNQAGLATAADNNGEVRARYLHVDFGFQFMGFEPFFGSTFLTETKNTQLTVNPNQGVQKLSQFDAGFRYKWESWTPYFAWKMHSETGTPIAGSIELKTRFNAWGFGLAHDTKVAEGVHIYKNVGLFLNYADDDTQTTGTLTNEAGRKFNHYIVPINVAFEGDATSWLVLRAGAGYTFWDEKVADRTVTAPSASGTDRKVSQAGAPTFRIGSTLKFGKIHVDSAFGNGAASTTGTSTGTGNVDSSAIGFDSQLFGLVSASYHW